MKRLMLIVSLLSLSACGGKDAIPVYSQIIGSSGEITKTIAGQTSSASVAKESYVHNSLQNRDIQYRKAYEESGLKVEYGFQNYTASSGEVIAMYLPKTMSFRPAPNFSQLGGLPIEPSRHPVWASATKLGIAWAKYGLIGHLGGKFFDFLGDSWAATGATYSGPVNLVNSQNTAGGEQEFSASDLIIGSDYSPEEIVGIE